MEKLKAHYSLQEIQAMVARDGSRTFTFTAQQGAKNMGLTRAEALGVVLALTGSMLFKSMTTNSDNKIWQDVYHAPCPNGKVA
jgi:motility quorum-sensing regulator/GCU-specific mRNA interferase toxin